MVMTSFRPEVEGYEFVNSWTFDERERAQIQGILSGAAASMALGAGPIGPLLAPLGPLAAGVGLWAAAQIARGLSGTYGRCGGLVSASLDYFRRGWPLPRGTSAQPTAGNPHDRVVRDYIYRRLIDSLTLNAATTLAWMAVLKLTPFGGGVGNLWNMTKGQFVNLKPILDAGNPWPLGIIGTTDNPTDNHQVLAIGYDS